MILFSQQRILLFLFWISGSLVFSRNLLLYSFSLLHLKPLLLIEVFLGIYKHILLFVMFKYMNTSISSPKSHCCFSSSVSEAFFKECSCPGFTSTLPVYLSVHLNLSSACNSAPNSPLLKLTLISIMDFSSIWSNWPLFLKIRASLTPWYHTSFSFFGTSLSFSFANYSSNSPWSSSLGSDLAVLFLDSLPTCFKHAHVFKHFLC